WDQMHGPMYLVNSPDSTIIGAYSYCDSMSYPSSDGYNRDALIKIDLQGNVVWEKKYGKSLWNKYLRSVNINDKGDIIVTGNIQGSAYHLEGYSGYLFKFSIDGDSLWYREYQKLKELFSFNYLYGVTPTSDGGYIAVGDVSPYPPDTGNQDVWVIKVDSMGCESWNDCWVGEPEHIALRNEEKLVIYPNPANRVINIFIPKENESEIHTLSIFDLFGRKVEERKVGSGETTVGFNVTGWKAGLYTVIVSYNGSISGRGRFVVN
ncbi:MAG: T9SS type A sorting domain-containing protein, partial [Bacteroidetes bacterium]|nr:T9SS type A sorting domain-containing protein [Bacteroidota bacterium]